MMFFRLMQNLVVAIIVGLMFLQLGFDQNAITNRYLYLL